VSQKHAQVRIPRGTAIGRRGLTHVTLLLM
jgi:hypothetical protein